MMTINELLGLKVNTLCGLSSMEIDPLGEDDMLQEAQVLDVRYNASSAVLGVLFELRQSLQFDQGNTGVLVCNGVQTFSWETSQRSSLLTAWSVETSTPRVGNGNFSFTLGLLPSPGDSLRIVSAGARFFVVNVEGLEGAPPDYGDLRPDWNIPGVAHWDSLITVRSAVSAGSPR